MLKIKIISHHLEDKIKKEREFLSKGKNPFIINLLCSYQDKENLYLVLELLTGGDLRFHIKNYNYTFKENQIKFLISNLILSCAYIHPNGIVHRDIKPENIIFDSLGYAHLTDFSISKYINDKNDSIGTPSYMSPEALFNKNQTFISDFYSIGVIGYELLMKQRPYFSKRKKDIRNEILSKQAFIDYDENFNYSEYCISFINSLIEKNPTKRLGYYNNVKDLINHYWLRDVDWKELYNKKIYSPFIEVINSSKRNFHINELYDNEFDDEYNFDDENYNQYKKIFKKTNYNKLFRNYDCLSIGINNISNSSNFNYEKDINYPVLGQKKSYSLKNIILRSDRIIERINPENVIYKIPSEMYNDEEEVLKFFYSPSIQRFSNFDNDNNDNLNLNNYRRKIKPILKMKYQNSVLKNPLFNKKINKSTKFLLSDKKKSYSNDKENSVNDYFKKYLFVPINNYNFSFYNNEDDTKKVKRKFFLNESLTSFENKNHTKIFNIRRKYDKNESELPDISNSSSMRNKFNIKIRLKRPKKHHSNINNNE